MLNGFISYNWEDDIDEQIQKFKKSVQIESYNSFANSINFFIDKENIRAGKDIWSIINQNLPAAKIIIAIYSMSYFKSDSCRKELNEILDIINSKSDVIFIPINYYENNKLILTNNDGDELISKIKGLLYKELPNRARLDDTSAEYKKFIYEIAEEIDLQLKENRIPAANEVRDRNESSEDIISFDFDNSSLSEKSKFSTANISEYVTLLSDKLTSFNRLAQIIHIDTFRDLKSAKSGSDLWMKLQDQRITKTSPKFINKSNEIIDYINNLDEKIAREIISLLDQKMVINRNQYHQLVATCEMMSTLVPAASNKFDHVKNKTIEIIELLNVLSES